MAYVSSLLQTVQCYSIVRESRLRPFMHQVMVSSPLVHSKHMHCTGLLPHGGSRMAVCTMCLSFFVHVRFTRSPAWSCTAPSWSCMAH